MKNFIKYLLDKINALDPAKIDEILQKIPELEAKILAMDISDYKKKLYINVLEALKDILQEKLEASTSAEEILNEVF
jgi:hypothetical protein